MQEGKRQSLLVVLNREIVQYIDTGAEFINYCIALMMNKDCLVDITIPQCNFNRWIKNVASKRHVMLDVVDGIIGVPITLHFIQRYYLTIVLMYCCLKCNILTFPQYSNLFYTEMNQSIQLDTASYPIPILIRNSSMHPNVTASVRVVQSSNNSGYYFEAVGMNCKCSYKWCNSNSYYCTYCYDIGFKKCAECDLVNVCEICCTDEDNVFNFTCNFCKRNWCMSSTCIEKANWRCCDICSGVKYCGDCDGTRSLEPIDECEICELDCCGSCYKFCSICMRIICLDCEFFMINVVHFCRFCFSMRCTECGGGSTKCDCCAQIGCLECVRLNYCCNPESRPIEID